MSSSPNFRSNCGERLDTDIDIEECPKCHTALHEHSKHKLPRSSVVEQIPHKSPGNAALIALIGRIFGIMGVGHIYVGKVVMGIGILISGIVLVVLAIVLIFSIVPFAVSNEVPTTELASYGVWVPILGAVFGIAYFVLFIWQIFNARKYTKKFNEVASTTHKEPW